MTRRPWGWLPLVVAARVLGLDPDDLEARIARGEVRALFVERAGWIVAMEKRR